MARAVSGWDDLDTPRPDDEGGFSLPVWGVIAGLLLPIVGFVIAIVLLLRGQVGPGLGVVLASCLGLFAAVALML